MTSSNRPTEAKPSRSYTAIAAAFAAATLSAIVSIPSSASRRQRSAQSAVAPMQQIDLSGSYPGGDGAILQVQRFEGGSWVDFPVTMLVTGDSFDTFILTGHTGVNRIRVIDTTNGDKSNEIKVTVG